MTAQFAGSTPSVFLFWSFVASSFGGISGDLLIGVVRPAALTDSIHLLVSVLAAHRLLLACERRQAAKPRPSVQRGRVAACKWTDARVDGLSHPISSFMRQRVDKLSDRSER